MYAFKVSGVAGNYDTVADFNIYEYANSLPDEVETIKHVDDFKEYSAQYFTPSTLKQGLVRNRSNIQDVQAIIFDLDLVVDANIFLEDFFKLYTETTKLNVFAWQTPSSFGPGKHIGGWRIFLPLGRPIMPELLPQAVDELVILFAKTGFNLLNYGLDIGTAKTVGRLNGLPLKKTGVFGPLEEEKDRFNYIIKSKYQPKSPYRKSNMNSNGSGWSGLDEPSADNLSEFIIGYTNKNRITWNKGERDNNLVKVIGAIKTAFPTSDPDEIYDGFEQAGITTYLDNPEKDIGVKLKRLLRG